MEPDDTPQEPIAGRYQIVRELGRGGSAVVYLARDTRTLGGLVALKLLAVDASSSHIAQRFAQEVRLMADFHHPHILPVTDSGEWQGRPWYTMLYVDGETLETRLRRERRLAVADVVRLARDICSALSYAHARRVIHRDVKPSNILLAGDHAYLSDFGIAKALEPVAGQPTTTTGVAVGTRAYMSPEQLAADRDLDERSDLYSLACVLFEALAGQHPFHSADENRMVSMRFVAPPDSLRRHREAVTESMDAVIRRALAIEPADRWRSVGEFAEALVSVEGEGESRKSAQPPGLSASAESAPHTATSGSRPVAEKLRTRLFGWGGGLSLLVLAGVATLVARRSSTSPTCGVARQTGTAPHVLLLVDTVPSALRAQVIATWRDAASRWSDVQVVEGSAARAEACSALERGSATHVVRLTGVATHDTVRWAATVLFAGDHPGTVLTLTRDSDSKIGSVLNASRGLLDEALVPRSAERTLLFAASATRRWAAWERFAVARVALDDGAVSLADSLLRESVRADPAFGIAAAWSSWVRSLKGGLALLTAPPRDAMTTWLSLSSVPEGERAMLLGIASLSAGTYEESCQQWSGEGARRPASALVQLGWGDCYGADDRIVSDETGEVRFAASYAAALRHYRLALDHCVAELCAVAFARVERVLPDMPQIRQGARRDGGTPLAALQSLDGDSLAHHPISVADIRTGAAGTIPPSLGDALTWARGQRVRLAEAWLARDSLNPEGHAALARALELRGMLTSRTPRERSALSENRRSRELARTDEQRVRADLIRGRLLLRAGAFDSVVLLADELLRRRRAEPKSVRPTAELAGLLVAIGRSSDAASVLAEHMATADAGGADGPALPSAAMRPTADLLVLSALGVCGDTLRALEVAIRRVVDIEVGATKRASALERAFNPALRLRAWCDGYRALASGPRNDDPLLPIQRRAALGDSSDVKRRLRQLWDERRAVAIAEVSLDQAVQEALLLAAVGDSATAAAHWRSAYEGLRTSSGFTLSELPQAAAIGRGLARFGFRDARGGRDVASSEGPDEGQGIERLWRTADDVVQRSAGLLR